MNVEELLEKYAADHRDFSGLNLSQADFSGANLRGIDLSRSTLSAAKLARVNLSRSRCQHSNFQGATLTLADLSNANLQSANFSKAELVRAEMSAANLTEANLSYADLREAKLSGARLDRANLSRADLRSAHLVWANLAAANLASSDLSVSNLSCADFRQAELRQTNLNRANLQGANFQGANLRWADLSGADLRYADLTDAKLSGANLTGANLADATLLNTILVHVDLTRANLASVDWAGADLSGSLLTGAKLHRVSPFGVITAEASCRWIDLSPNGDQSQVFRFQSDDLSEYFHRSPPIVQIAIDDRLTPDAHCALAVAYQQMARQGGGMVPPHIEIRRRRTILRFELDRDARLFVTAYLAIFPFSDAETVQHNLLNALKAVSVQVFDPASNGLKQYQQWVTELSQSIHQLDCTKLLQAIPIVIQKIRFFQAPTRIALLNSSQQSLTIYDNPQFGKRRIEESVKADAPSAENEAQAKLTVSPTFYPLTAQEAIRFIQGFHPVLREL